jgi:aminopeptidase-like protein
MNTTEEKIGDELHDLIGELYPICRSITGDGVRRTLDILQRHIPLRVREVPSGTAVLDWTVPKEWNLRDAYIRASDGTRVIDVRDSNLHVVGYSRPVHASLSLEALKPHLHTLPAQPDLVPYRTSYYADTWGFCMSHRALLALKDDVYEVRIDSSLEPGSLTFGECYLPGERADEILISCHVCHPSLANDNLSGIALATLMARRIHGQARRYSYRFLFVPGTIGSITWLALHENDAVPKVKHGLVLACVGDAGRVTYKRSRQGNAQVDRAAAYILGQSGDDYELRDFSPYGYDERQFCSPGFDLPVGCLMRTPHGEFPEYHTSGDNLDLVRPFALEDSFKKLGAILQVLDDDRRYLNTNPKGEPQLGRRGLYKSLGGGPAADRVFEQTMLWVLNLSDGHHSLLDIAERSGLPFPAVKSAADVLEKHALLAEVAA